MVLLSTIIIAVGVDQFRHPVYVFHCVLLENSYYKYLICYPSLLLTVLIKKDVSYHSSGRDLGPGNVIVTYKLFK